jgi:hypothetical protein
MYVVIYGVWEILGKNTNQPRTKNKKPREKAGSLGVLYDSYPVKFPEELIEQSYL